MHTRIIQKNYKFNLQQRSRNDKNTYSYMFHSTDT